jgi:hypothetical protein
MQAGAEVSMIIVAVHSEMVKVMTHWSSSLVAHGVDHGDGACGVLID